MFARLKLNDFLFKIRLRLDTGLENPRANTPTIVFSSEDTFATRVANCKITLKKNKF